MSSAQSLADETIAQLAQDRATTNGGNRVFRTDCPDALLLTEIGNLGPRVGYKGAATAYNGGLLLSVENAELQIPYLTFTL